MYNYTLPEILEEEIAMLEALMAKYKRGEISAAELKAHRVPFGVYEQREPDTYMMRVRCAIGAITPRQLEGVVLIAEKYGISVLHITTRQELQLHYARIDDLILLIRALKEIGLATRGGGGNTVRNITAQEDAGIDPQELFDVSPYAVALTTRLLSENDSWTLPRKFKIAFSGSPEDKGYATIADLGFIAQLKDGKRGFRVYVAGGLGAKPQASKLLLDFIEEDKVYAVAKAVKNVFWKYGNRKNKHAARLRFLWQGLGEEEFKQRFQEEFAAVEKQSLPVLGLAGVEDDVRDTKLIPQEPEDAQGFALWKVRFVRLQKQDGLFSVLVPIELGFISVKDALVFARFLSKFGDDVIRMTKEQNFLLRNIPQGYLGNVYNFLKNTLPNFNQPVILGKVLSCAGASTCQLGICLSRQAASALIKALRESGLDLDRLADIKLNISGCPNSCGQHPAAVLGFSGKAARKEGRLYPAYNVLAAAYLYDGQTRLAETVGEVAAKNLPLLVKNFLVQYLSRGKDYKGFREYIFGEGKEDLKKLCAKYKGIPGFDQDKNYYFDWGTDKLFSLAQRRAGECSAGLFDLIEIDLGNIKETRNKLLAADMDKERKVKLIYELAFFSSRMLLITRGSEPKQESEVFLEFSRHFIETGLVEPCFRKIIEAARDKDYSSLILMENTALALAEKADFLYEHMDNSFNFKIGASGSGENKGTEAVGSADKQISPTPKVIKDFRGVACPMNFVKTKIELARLKPGERLEVWLDDGAPIENVPGSVQAEGNKIISQKKIDNYWSVVIEKR